MSSAICDLLEHEPVNKESADKIASGHCPECNSDKLVRWRPGQGFHDLCAHFHCLGCDADFCWPIAWDPPMPVIKMKGELSPQHRRDIAEQATADGIEVPGFWKPIMESDLQPVHKEAVLRCFECHAEKKVEVIVEAGYWRWPRGKWPRGGWLNTGEMYYSKERGTNIIYARCATH